MQAAESFDDGTQAARLCALFGGVRVTSRMQLKRALRFAVLCTACRAQCGPRQRWFAIMKEMAAQQNVHTAPPLLDRAYMPPTGQHIPEPKVNERFALEERLQSHPAYVALVDSEAKSCCGYEHRDLATLKRCLRRRTVRMRLVCSVRCHLQQAGNRKEI
jgi:hypothetical protein